MTAPQKAAADAPAKKNEKAAADAPAKGKRLASFVHVDGVAYGPDDKIIPADVAKKITNEKAWA